MRSRLSLKKKPKLKLLSNLHKKSGSNTGSRIYLCQMANLDFVHYSCYTEAEWRDGFMIEKTERLSVSKSEAERYAAQIARTVLHAGVEHIRYLGGGSFGFVYLVQISRPPHRVVMKAFRAKGLCLREAMQLETLGQDSLIAVPGVYFVHKADETVPIDFLCMEHMPGTDCFTDFKKLLLSKKTKERFADEVTTAIRHWHLITNDAFGPLDHAVYKDWFDYYRPFSESVLQSARELAARRQLQPRVLRTMEEAWSAFDLIFSEPVEKPGLIHGDLNVMNILSDGRLHPLAIIDPLESKWADPEYELFQLRNLTGDRFGLYEMYKRKYTVSKNCDLKTAFYALYHEVYAYLISGAKSNAILLPLVRKMNSALQSIK